MANQAEDATPHVNHRSRMRQRVRENGLETLHEHEALEYLLFFVIPRKDTNVLAHRLIGRFHSFCGVLEASEEELAQVQGIGPVTAHFLHVLLETTRYYTLHKRGPHHPLATTEAMIEYVRPLFLGYQEELFYLVAMNDAFDPLRTILISRGLPNKVRFDPQKLARTAVACNCTCALLAHNHPAGPALPSMADQQATDSIVRLLGPLGIRLVDHIIITPNDAASLQRISRMPRYDPAIQDIRY